MLQFTDKSVVLGFAIAYSSPAVAQVTDTTATVASWNIEGFGGITDQVKIDRLAEGIVALDAEVIGIQEVNPDSVAQSIVTKANSLGAGYAPPVV